MHTYIQTDRHTDIQTDRHAFIKNYAAHNAPNNSGNSQDDEIAFDFEVSRIMVVVQMWLNEWMLKDPDLPVFFVSQGGMEPPW